MSKPIHVSFQTNIDFYHNKRYPEWLEFRPQLGDKVPFADQDRNFQRYPCLEIISIEYTVGRFGEVLGFICELWFNKNIDPELRSKILNHERL